MKEPPAWKEPASVPPVLKDPLCKPEFPDDFTKIKGISALAPTQHEFDWETLRRTLGEQRESLEGPDYEALAVALGVVLRWMCKGRRLDIMGRRAVALATVFAPDIFESKQGKRIFRMAGYRTETVTFPGR